MARQPRGLLHFAHSDFAVRAGGARSRQRRPRPIELFNDGGDAAAIGVTRPAEPARAGQLGKQRAAVVDALPGVRVQPAQFIEDAAQNARLIPKHEAVEQGRDLQIAIRCAAPGYGCAVGQRRQRYRGRLHMAVVAPVRHQIAARAVGQARFGGVEQVAQGVVEPPDQRVPGGGAGAHPKGQAGFGEGPHMALEAAQLLRRDGDAEIFKERAQPGGQRGVRIRRFVVPGQRNAVALRQRAQAVRMAAQHIAPEQHLAAVGVQAAQQALQVFQKHMSPAARAHGLLRCAAPQLEGLVAADVDAAALVVRQQFAAQRERKGGVLLVRRQGGGREGSGQTRLHALRRFGAGAVAGQFEPAPHVAEGVLIRAELNAGCAALAVEPCDIGGVQGRSIAPDFFVAAVGKGVLGVELQVVDAQQRQPLHQQRQGFAGGDAIPAHIEQIAAQRKIRRVFYGQRGQPRARIALQLREALLRIAQTVRAAVRDLHRRAAGVQSECLAAEFGALLHFNCRVFRRARAGQRGDSPRARQQRRAGRRHSRGRAPRSARKPSKITHRSQSSTMAPITASNHCSGQCAR